MTWWVWVSSWTCKTHAMGLDNDLQQQNIMSRMKHLATAARPGRTTAGIWHKSEHEHQAEIQRVHLPEGEL